MKIKQIGIYKVTAPNGKVYIGQTNNFYVRIQHYRRLQCKAQRRLYDSLIKYGYDNHLIEFIEDCSIDLLNERERYYQELYDCIGNNGLNMQLVKTKDKKMTFCGEILSGMAERMKGNTRAKGLVHSDEQIIKMRLRAKGNTYSLGRKHKDEAKRKMSEWRKGRPKSAEHRLAIGAGQKGKDGVLILDFETGIYYNSITNAAIAKNMKSGTLDAMIRGRNSNRTSLVKV